jgi:hypothetical protein
MEQFYLKKLFVLVFILGYNVDQLVIRVYPLPLDQKNPFIKIQTIFGL